MILSKLDGTIPVAYLNIRGAAVLVAFIEAGQAGSYPTIQAAAAREGFRGEVAAVWKDGDGRTGFIAPPQQHPFFQATHYDQLRAQANGTMEAVL